MPAGATWISAREGYALWAETWEAAGSPIVALEERALLPWIEPLRPRCAVDVGCGAGRWTARLSAIGLDASPAMLALASRKPGLRGRLAAADAVALPVATGCADLVLCTLTLAHVRDRAAALCEFARVLQPGGSLVLTDFHPAAAARGWRRTFRRGDTVYELENHPYTIEQLRHESPDLVLTNCITAELGEPERPLFLAAGREELFAAARGVPAVLLSRWIRK